MEECLDKRFKCLKNLNDFYVFIKVKEGGRTNACICMGIHRSAFTTEPLD